MKQPVAVVIVSWNSAEVIAACLESVQAQEPVEFVVIDNASHDNTVELLRRRFPRVRVIVQDDNIGFAAGCNRGVEVTDAPYVLFLNDDAILEPSYLSILVDALQRDRKAASAMGKLVYEKDGERYIDSAGIDLGAHALRPLDRGHGKRDRGQFDTAQEIFGSTAAAALYRREALVEVGLFDEELFAYYEDVDLAWRLGQRGYTHLYVPSVVAVHARRGPEKKPTEISSRAFFNRYRVWLKNESLSRFARYALLAVPWESARLLRTLLRHPRRLKDARRMVEDFREIIRRRLEKP